MPSRLFHSHVMTGAIGLVTVAVGSITQEQLATWVGLASIVWAGLLAGYDRWRAVRRNNERLDLEAKLTELNSERDALEVRIDALRSELSGWEISRNQRCVEEGK